MNLKEQHLEVRNILEKGLYENPDCFVEESKNDFLFSENQLRELAEMYLDINKNKNIDSEKRKKNYYKDNGRLFHVVESFQFNADEVEYYSKLALDLKRIFKESDAYKINAVSSLLKNKIIFNFFIQPSSRTHRSFEAASTILGAKVINEKDMDFSSLLSRKETFADSIRTFYHYADAFIIRTPWNFSAEEAIFSQKIYEKCKPVINAGSGGCDHPTQGLLDVTTVKESLNLTSFKELEKRKIVIVGTKYFRALKSFINIITTVSPNSEYVFVNPLRDVFPCDLIDILNYKCIKYSKSTKLTESLKNASVIYLACMEKQDNVEYRDKFFFSLGMVDLLNNNAVIMHPLPRVDEIDYRIDRMSVSGIWKQVENGKFLRAILLLACFDKLDDLNKIVESK